MTHAATKTQATSPGSLTSVVTGTFTNADGKGTFNGTRVIMRKRPGPLVNFLPVALSGRQFRDVSCLVVFAGHRTLPPGSRTLPGEKVRVIDHIHAPVR
jgi:hypothetical protein